MNAIEVSTVVRRPPEPVYDFLLDFPGYANYSKYLTSVEQNGTGGAGTEYAMRFAWWKLSYTARSEVTSTDRPSRIDWRVVKHLDAAGAWLIDPLERADTERTRVRFVVEYDPDSVHAGHLDLPRFVSLDGVIERALPLVRGEAERVVQRAVADLEGSRRAVDLTVRTDGAATPLTSE